jgi:hypothetical protein
MRLLQEAGRDLKLSVPGTRSIDARVIDVATST